MVSCDKHTKSGCKGTKNSLIKILPHNQKLIFSKKTTSRKLKIIFYQLIIKKLPYLISTIYFLKREQTYLCFRSYLIGNELLYVNLHSLNPNKT